jgi:predicted acetyltransferase
VTSWAISAVTVATTHRRKGIARALIEAELRTANTLGIPIAILTVSEATIYGRFGFAPVALGADWEIDTRRATWSGPAASGRVQFVNVEQLRVQGRELAERARLAVPGEIELWDLRWNEQMLGDHAEGANATKNLRFVRYDDADGNAQGFAIYSFVESPDDFSAHTLTVRYLVAVTDEAYAGLWRFLIEVDLVTTVRAQLRSADEPFRWQLSDFRAARKIAEYDHLWARILDLKAALEARRYLASGRFVLEIDDPLGFVAPRVLVDIAATGVASVRPFEDALPDDAHGLAMSINEISALYLGGGSAATLARAGRISELRPGSVNAFDAAFRSDVAPWLGLWF